MATDRWDQIEALFERAVELSPEERPEFLEKKCGRDRELKNELECLLANDHRAGTHFLEPRHADRRLEHNHLDFDPLLNQRIGSYQTKSVIAHGGMGTVYLADQDNPRREVALKVMHSAPWSAAARKRFEYESQVLARLQHPNITQVFQAGIHLTESGAAVPFFAMEYLFEAKTITQHVRESHFDIRRSLELFLEVCDAVTHGHQIGVIHRDLKPDNILVTAEGRVKVIDFGVARAVDSDIAQTTTHTDAGQIIGTLQYMSPEQCVADADGIDTRTDVYSLGVVLFELLTGQTPYDVSRMTIHAAARVICEQAPASPSSLERRCRGDLETIVLKALEKSRAKRYTGVEALSADIRRYLNREPISAHPPNAWTKAMGWASRHPAPATAVFSAIIGLSVLAATVASVWYLDRTPYDLARYRRGKMIESDRLGPADELRLRARNGNPLRIWRKPSERITDGILVQKPESMGGGQLAIVGFDAGHKGRLAGSLCAFDVDGDFVQPLWQQRIENSDLPDDERAKGPSRGDFGVFLIYDADVFPDEQSPGPELVVVFFHSYSRRAIRIIDLSGRLLYQVWHDGDLTDVRWLPSSKKLICLGADEGAKALANESNSAATLFPTAFAICPEFMFISSEYLSQTGTDARLRFVWNRYFSPPHSSQSAYHRRISGVRTDQATGVARIGISIEIYMAGKLDLDKDDDYLAAFGVVIDEHGNLIQGTQEPGDFYLKSRAKHNLPDPSEFQLTNEPPTEVWSPESSQRL